MTRLFMNMVRMELLLFYSFTATGKMRGQYYFTALAWRYEWYRQTANIHELIKLILPLGLWFSQKWKPNECTVPFKPNLSLHLLCKQQNPLYRSLLLLHIHTHRLTFAVAASQASSHWHGEDEWKATAEHTHMLLKSTQLLFLDKKH